MGKLRRLGDLAVISAAESRLLIRVRPTKVDSPRRELIRRELVSQCERKPIQAGGAEVVEQFEHFLSQALSVNQA